MTKICPFMSKANVIGSYFEQIDCVETKCMAWSEDYDYCKLIGFMAEIPK